MYTDIDECALRPNVCGVGTCINNDDGRFYECVCPDGAVRTGSSSDGTLRCFGMFIHLDCVHINFFQMLTEMCDSTTCQNGGVCTSESVCDCTGTQFTGDTCETPGACPYIIIHIL